MTMDAFSVAEAMGYLGAGLSVLPAWRTEKRPAVGSWKEWSERLPSESEVRSWFGKRQDGVCIVAGAVSGNLECLDFDNHGELFGAWRDKVNAALLARLVIEQSPSGGFHVVYRCQTAIDGNLKLARGMRNGKLVTLIETRGEGGLFLCSPTTGYVLQQSDFTLVPTLTADERNSLLAAARVLDEVVDVRKTSVETPRGVSATGRMMTQGNGVGSDRGAFSCESGGFLVRPGDDFCNRGDIRPILESNGWQYLRTAPDGNEFWRRPGKTAGGLSATFNGDVFYVFSSNAAPLECGKGYNRFQVYAELECRGDYTRAAKELLAKGYGSAMPKPPVPAPVPARSEKAQTAKPPFLFLDDLVQQYPKMKPVLIHGFLRRGETMNIIAPPKTGKSWLVTDIALSVATGTPWFGFACEKGKVLIIDNELHPETSASRIPKVVEARGMNLRDVQRDIAVWNQRGALGNIEELADMIQDLKPYGFKLVIIDAFYRAMPKGTDENDNGTVAGIYNLIDKYAAALDCAFVLIHHTSKGNQSQKSVTDVGAGAGSQSRASDTHVILRRHKERDAVVMESVVRSFPSIKPVCLRWKWPLWSRDTTLNPEELEGKSEAAKGKDKEQDEMSVEELAAKLKELVNVAHPLNKGLFIEKVRTTYGVTGRTAKLAVECAIRDGSVKCGRQSGLEKGNQAAKFVTLPEI